MCPGEEHPAQREHHNGGHLQRCPRYQTKVTRSGVLRYLASYDLVYGMILRTPRRVQNVMKDEN